MLMSNRNDTHNIIVSCLKRLANAGIRRIILLTILMAFLLVPAGAVYSYAETLKLKDLIKEAILNSPDLAAMKSKASASTHRAPQARSLPDPMFMVGYQNMGTRAYTYGDEDSQWMFTASQMFPYPGKLGLKGEMAEKESESLKYESEMAEINLIQRIRELYSDLFLAYKELEIAGSQKVLFEKIEEASLARYASGMGGQQDVLMAQTEKYMLMENGEMLKAKISSIEAMMANGIGRNSLEPLGKPDEPESKDFKLTLDEAVKKAMENSPELKARQKMAEASAARLGMAEKEYLPDITLSAGYSLKGGGYDDMVNFSATANLPIFFKTKQREGVYEAKKLQEQSRHETDAAKLMITAKIRDNYAMLKSFDKLTNLYKNAILPKNRRDFEQSLATFSSGKTEASMALEKLKKLMDSETAHWKNMNEKEKVIARIEALAAIAVPENYLSGGLK